VPLYKSIKILLCVELRSLSGQPFKTAPSVLFTRTRLSRPIATVIRTYRRLRPKNNRSLLNLIELIGPIAIDRTRRSLRTARGVPAASNSEFTTNKSARIYDFTALFYPKLNFNLINIIPSREQNNNNDQNRTSTKRTFPELYYY
jgi:hypothetical protein